MKVAIPLAEGKLAVHFGHCQEFAFIDVEDKTIKGKEIIVPPPHEPGLLPKWLHEHGIKLVIAGGMGARAVGLLQQNGIEVITGAPASPPEDLVGQYLNQTLTTGENLCDH